MKFSLKLGVGGGLGNALLTEIPRSTKLNEIALNFESVSFGSKAGMAFVESILSLSNISRLDRVLSVAITELNEVGLGLTSGLERLVLTTEEVNLAGSGLISYLENFMA